VQAKLNRLQECVQCAYAVIGIAQAVCEWWSLVCNQIGARMVAYQIGAWLACYEIAGPCCALVLAQISCVHKVSMNN
jgi:hypothetical protein